MSEKDKVTVSLVAGFFLALAAGGVLLYTPGRAHIATGIVWGVVIAYLGFLLFYFLIPRPGSSGPAIPFLQGYMPGVVVRYIVMIGALCIVVFWMHVHPAGVLIGAFLGMMTSTFISLGKIKQTPPASRQTRTENPEE